MNRMMKSLAILTMILSVLFAGCGLYRGDAPAKAPDSVAPPEQELLPAPQEQPEPEFEPVEVSLVAVGDNLIHNSVYLAAQNGNTYDFRPMYEPVKQLIESADLAFINQETPMGGKGYKPSGYPTFNSPQEVGDALVDTGFDLINLANNHMMDSGKGALLGTISYWKQHPEVMTTGVYESAQDRAAPRIIEKNGLRIGLLGYTYGTNGIPLPKDMPWLVATIEEETIKKEVSALRPQCDALIVSMHWGQEYQTTPSKEQERLAKLLADLGVDVVIGTHPHVIQPAEFITGKGGNKTFVAYSLGNFLSGQNKPMRLLGGMLKLKLRSLPEGGVSIESPGLIPLVTYYRKGYFRVYPLYAYTDQLAGSQAIRKKGNVTPAFFQQEAETIFGEYYTYGKDDG